MLCPLREQHMFEFEQESQIRRELVELPFKKKIEILIQLQKMAKGTKRTGGQFVIFSLLFLFF